VTGYPRRRRNSNRSLPRRGTYFGALLRPSSDYATVTASGSPTSAENSHSERITTSLDLSGTAELLARFLGIALIGLGLACWPGPPRLGMSFYGGAAAIFLAYVGLAERLVGPLLWPAVVLPLMLVASFVWGSKR
jgi:hypothetical protein